jgi:hypothetical protein
MKPFGRGPFFFLTLLLLLGLVGAVLFSPVVLTGDGYSHLYNSAILNRLLAGDQRVRDVYSIQSILVPNWLATALLSLFIFFLPPVLGLKLFVLLVVFTTLAGLLYWAWYLAAWPPEETGVYIAVFLPFALSGFITFGFLSMSLGFGLFSFVMGTMLRYQLQPPVRVQLLLGAVLVATFLCHPIPLLLSGLLILIFLCFLSPKLGVGQLAVFWVRAGWPWLPAALLLLMSRAKVVGTGKAEWGLGSMKQSVVILLSSPLYYGYIAPNFRGQVLYLVLLAILAGAVLTASLEPQDPGERAVRKALFCFAAVCVALFVVVPDEIGGAGYIRFRFLYGGILAVVLLAVSFRALRLGHLRVAAWMAMAYMSLYTADYVFTSFRAAPMLREVQSAFRRIPPSSRVLLVTYNSTLGCEGLPLILRTTPEEHWAETPVDTARTIIVNNYEASVGHFPLAYRFRLVPGAGYLQKIEFAQAFLESHPELIDYAIVWGHRRCIEIKPENPAAGLEAGLRTRGFSLQFENQGVSRVAAYRAPPQ